MYRAPPKCSLKKGQNHYVDLDRAHTKNDDNPPAPSLPPFLPRESSSEVKDRDKKAAQKHLVEASGREWEGRPGRELPRAVSQPRKVVGCVEAPEWLPQDLWAPGEWPGRAGSPNARAEARTMVSPAFGPLPGFTFSMEIALMRTGREKTKPAAGSPRRRP